MLKRLSGRTHTVHTAIALRCHARNLRIDETTTSQVTFKPLDDPTIDAYLRIVNPLDKAGAYGIQEGRHLIIDHYEGSLTNIMGLPLETLLPHLTRCGYQITN
jgi:septum formation protein